MKLVTATILAKFQLNLTNNRPLVPIRRGLTLSPPSSFKMRVKKQLTTK